MSPTAFDSLRMPQWVPVNDVKAGPRRRNLQRWIGSRASRSPMVRRDLRFLAVPALSVKRNIEAGSVTISLQSAMTGFQNSARLLHRSQTWPVFPQIELAVWRASRRAVLHRGNRMFELKPIARHLLLACGGLAGSLTAVAPAAAQQPPAQEQRLDRITITGTHIRRTDAETVAPIEIITREEIEKSGKATVADVLRTLPAATGGSFNEAFSNSFAPGAAGISLRGLGQKTTLVLINGRRVAGYGFAQNLQDTFVDLNSIPTAAVERIEVLKDGASAIYGSDAIAGVVNVILRRDFRGAETAASIGFFEGKQDYRASVAVGFGDLGAQRFNAFGVVDFYKRDELLMSDTKFGASRDMRGEQGGRNFQSITAGGVWTGVPGSANANERRAISECSRWGRVIGFQEALNLGFIAAAGTDPAAASVQAFNLPGNTWCLVDINNVLSALPGTQRIGFMGRATFEVSPTVQAYAEVGLSRNETEQTFTPPFFAGTTGLQSTPAGLRPFTYNVNFAPGVAGNPLATNARFTGNLYDLGTRNLEITSDSMRLLAGIQYSLLGFDFDSAVGYSNNEIEQININRITLAGTSALFGVGTGPQPPVPLSTASTCNLDRPSTTPACRGALIDFPRTAKSELTFIDTKATTETSVTLPGGPIGAAVGVEYRNEKIEDSPDPRAAAGDILGQGITATDGSRHQAAAFVEFALPLTRALEAQVAMRHDHYSDFGSSTNPKVGLKFRPTANLLLRANWGRGFRAPTLPEISPSVATFFTQVNDPFTAQAGVQISGVFAGNPFLQAERSRSATLGFVWEPTTHFSAGVDVFEINWTGIVGSDSFQSIVNADSSSRLAGGSGDPRVIRDLTNPITVPLPGGATRTAFPVVTVLSNYRNLSDTFVRGTDVDLRFTVPSTVGRFTTRLNASYLDDFKEEGVQYAGANGGSNTYPRWKGTLTQDWERGSLLVRGAINYVHSYYQQWLAGSFFVPPVNPLAQTGVYPDRVPSYTTFDLFARYSVTPKLQVSASIVNLTDETPPYDPGFSSTFLYDFTQYDVRGRQYRVGVSYKF